MYVDATSPYPFGGSTYDHNATYGQLATAPCPNGLYNETNALCSSPQLVDMSWHVYGFGNMAPASAASAVVGRGVAIPGMTTDFHGNTRPNPPSLGGMEFVTGTPTAATPSGAPAPGTFTTAQSITLSTATSGAKICYTTDGSNPTTTANNCGAGSTPYTTPINVATTTTLKAIATLSGYTDSGIFSGLYTITAVLPVAATPSAVPSPGTFTSAQSVTLSTATSGAKICVTTDGSNPTTSGNNCGAGSTLYTGPIGVAATTTLKAIATLAGYTDSSIFSGLYSINIPPPTAATPAATPAPGIFTAAPNVALTSLTSGARICYTTNGSNPTTSANNCGAGSTTYSNPINVAATSTLKAIATLAGFTDSGIFSGLYTIDIVQGPVATPTPAPAPGVFTGTITVSLFTATTGATICYTTNGTTPDCGAGSTIYTSPIVVSSTTTIKAIAALAGRTNSNVFTGLYTITAPPAVIVIGGVEIRPAPGVLITDARVINGHVSFAATSTGPTSSIATVFYKNTNLKYLSCAVVGNGEPAPPHGLTWSSTTNNTLVIATQNALQPGERLNVHIDCWTA
jgi:hypothetical protein